ncbi:hypothetical protein AKJ65_04445 [candidate division MSBL1 archaeon SCGC-AAA259E19]|uniref:Flippase-like domain-containing protein n=1 Tax=candidate division MSBL1 archaeon SCGC-AAA259E19 TaxID=1698264 RepID=A0A133UJP4_9EURY|nr:hypothetical protein AKJ65_04445 [candidate division MSBL1 archaeon SCGC-AAA259E19]
MKGKEKSVRVDIKRAIIPIILAIVIIGLVSVLFFKIDMTKIVSELQEANYPLVIAAFIVYFLSAFIWSARWRVGILATGERVGIKELFPIVWGSMFVNNLTPLNRVGGDPIARPYLLKKRTKIKFRTGFSSVVGEQLFQIPVVLGLVAVGLSLRFLMEPSGILSIVSIVACAGIAVFLVPFFMLIFKKKGFSEKLAGFIAKILGLMRRDADREDITEVLEDFRKNSRKIISSRQNALKMVGLSIMLWAVDLFRIYLILTAVGITWTLPMLFLVSTLPQIAGLLPLLPGGIGAVGGTFTAVLTSFNIGKEVAFGAMLIERSMSLLFSTLVGAGFLSYLGIKIWKEE